MADIGFIYTRVWDTVGDTPLVKVEVRYYYNNELLETKLFEYGAPYPAVATIHAAAQAYCQTLFDARKDSKLKVIELEAYIGEKFTETVT